MKRLLKLLKRFFVGLIIVLLLCVGLLYITDYDYILKGVRVVYLTGHTTAYIDDYPNFENMDIAVGNPTPTLAHA